MFSNPLHLLTKSKVIVRPLESMVNSLLKTNGHITEKIVDNMAMIEELEMQNKVLQNQRKSNHGIISKLNLIIKGEE